MSASAGRVLLMPKGAYSSGTTYNPLDYVTYTDGNTYVCKATTTGHAPTDTTYWQILVDNSGVVHTVDIANDLTTQTAGKVLDARQGYALNTSLAKVEPKIVTFAAFNSLPQTYPPSGTDPEIETDMACIHAELSNPSAILSNWEVDTDTAGKVTVGTGGLISGSTTLKIWLQKSR